MLQHFNICSFTLWMPNLLWMHGAVAPCAPPSSTRHWVRSTGGYFQKTWITYGQVRLSMYEIEK